MALLIDTQVIIWLESDPHKLSRETRTLISKESEVYFSDVSIWEMAIKIKTGKLSFDQNLETFIQKFQKDYQFIHLPIALEHIYKTQELEFHHKDPFDRLIIAQTIIEGFAIVSSDTIFDQYLSSRIW
ncbi:hypothetical protein BCY91_07450 [Pelobium manganitolerans]|uniref:PIN domain-containing protein n=1 Tax=Pelobium manganitolerans TaxID=1842495 RepID=A0A419S3T2_9SPHI|nr:type II toxin-antitoxin system VapC family toxin [Pelobium manganitolerans]RKD14314.1 hypothetical protein BCY91_07450 [Pelobium manganitolerans]